MADPGDPGHLGLVSSNAPSFPPGLFSSLEEAQASASNEMNEGHDRSDEQGFIEGQLSAISNQMRISRLYPSTQDFLQPLPGITHLGSFNRIASSREKPELEQSLSNDRDLAVRFHASLADMKQEMMHWIPELLMKNVSDYVSTQRNSQDQMQEIILEQVSHEKTTWAKVAALPDAHERQSVYRTNTVSGLNQPTIKVTRSEAIRPNCDEPLLRQHRVAFVSGFPEGARLSAVTTVLQNLASGPIMSIRLDRDPVRSILSACVIFQFAEDASRFVTENRAHMKTTGNTHYGSGISISMGGPWPEDNEIRSMSAMGKRERRRLTFSSSGLFTRVSRERFEAEIIAIAGKANVELIWLFNTGNATVILASVGSC